MVKTMKRGVSLMFVLALIASILVIPIEAKGSGKFSGYANCKITKDAETTSYVTSFSGYELTEVSITDGGKGAPTISTFDVNNGETWNTERNILTIGFSGGKKGTYTYKVKLYSGSTRVATKTIKVVNNGSW